MTDSSARLLEIFAVCGSNSIRRLDPRHTVWLIQRPGILGTATEKQKVDECKAEILRSLLASEERLFIHHEDPRDEDVPGEWVSRGDGVWEIPGGFELADDATARWLDLGNWHLYSAGSPVGEPLIDMVRSEPGRVAAFVERHGLAVIIDSFHDNDPWVVAIGAV